VVELPAPTSEDENKDEGKDEDEDEDEDSPGRYKSAMSTLPSRFNCPSSHVDSVEKLLKGSSVDVDDKEGGTQLVPYAIFNIPL
jgi:hypothetical protein